MKLSKFKENCKSTSRCKTLLWEDFPNAVRIQIETQKCFGTNVSVFFHVSAYIKVYFLHSCKSAGLLDYQEHCRPMFSSEHCHKNDHMIALPNTSFCPDPFKPNLEFLDPECFSKYNSATKFQADPQLVKDLPSLTCNEDQVLAQNRRCYAQDMQVRSASFSTEGAIIGFTEYVRGAGFMKTEGLFSLYKKKWRR